MSADITAARWGYLRPLERVDLDGAPFESRLEAVKISYALVPTLREDGSFVLSPLASRAGFMPRICDMEGLVEPSLWATEEVGLSDPASWQRSEVVADIPVSLFL